MSSQFINNTQTPWAKNSHITQTSAVTPSSKRYLIAIQVKYSEDKPWLLAEEVDGKTLSLVDKAKNSTGGMIAVFHLRSTDKHERAYTEPQY